MKKKLNDVARLGSLLAIFSASLMLTMLPSLQVAAQESFSVEDFKENMVYSPYAGRGHADQVFFGDTHVHTDLSPDAGLLGTNLDATTAFRFARGEKVTSNTGQPVQLIRPLDFLVISDHAEVMGLAPAVREANPVLLADPWGKWFYERFNAGEEGRMEAFGGVLEKLTTGDNPFESDELTRSIWGRHIKTADQLNEPGRFTAFIGYEWSSTPNGNNLHRVVVFRDDAEKAGQILPYSAFDSQDPENLWNFLAGYEKNTGGRVLAIPHNGNVSNGLMFSTNKLSGDPIDKAYAESRMRWEPIIEATQIKGDGESHPFLSPDDEFSDYENWDVGNIDGTAPKDKEMLQFEYARSALKVGLRLEKETGANPFQFGLSAASDAHTGLATTREENYFGKYAHTEPSPNRHGREVIPASDPDLRIISSQEVASGLTAVWARENTREAIFDAMQRKEVYATTGTRMRVRVFAGWDYSADDLRAPDFIDKGYRHGVPMGGNLTNAPEGYSPRFMIRALRDFDGANLDRIQIIKGWLDGNGDLHERIYDVAVTDGREIGADGRAREAVGNTVNTKKATYTNTIGDSMLAAFWEDPKFNPNENAFYYVRVLEIPTPRWTTYDAVKFEIDPPTNVPQTIQDRAYTSPIWYTP
jgi:hypothetical protein